MLKTHEISIGPILRALIGALGIIGIISGLPLAVRELWFAVHGEWIRLLTAGALLFIGFGGFLLLRGAIRGRIAVRSYHSRRRK